jgi:hypothetical protein
VPPDDILDAVIDRAEELAPALPPGVEARRICAPQLVGSGHDDRPRMRAIAPGVLPPRRRQEASRAHQRQHARLADLDPPRPQPLPHLAAPLAVKRTRLQHAADRRVAGSITAGPVFTARNALVVALAWSGKRLALLRLRDDVTGGTACGGAHTAYEVAQWSVGKRGSCILRFRNAEVVP